MDIGRAEAASSAALEIATRQSDAQALSLGSGCGRDRAQHRRGKRGYREPIGQSRALPVGISDLDIARPLRGRAGDGDVGGRLRRGVYRAGVDGDIGGGEAAGQRALEIASRQGDIEGLTLGGE